MTQKNYSNISDIHRDLRQTAKDANNVNRKAKAKAKAKIRNAE